jgi:hypothetical protein
MDENGKVEYFIEVSAADTNEEDIDHMTRQLLSELRETDVESAELLTSEDIPSGAKAGEAVTMGSIVISTLPTVLPAVIALVQSWVSRGPGRTVKFKGKGIEFEGSAEELQRVLETLEKQNKKRK